MSSTEQNALRPVASGDASRKDAKELLDDFSALLRQMGSTDFFYDLSSPSRTLRADRLDGIAGLGKFLEGHLNCVLVPEELPAIVSACEFAALGQSRELIALDEQLSRHSIPAPFAAASSRIGRIHLERLRPLRGERTVQRYLAAVDEGRCKAWHTVVFGLTLAVYSWPLRQGLMLYARQTLTVLAEAAARSHSMSELACADLLAPLLAKIPRAIEEVIGEPELR
jgi:urease accessory protein UreF